MSDYVLSCCSTADLSKEHMEQRDIRYICFHYELDGKQYADDLGQSMNFEDFYKAMENGADTRTSQVNAEEYEQYFETILKEGYYSSYAILRNFRKRELCDGCKAEP